MNRKYDRIEYACLAGYYAAMAGGFAAMTFINMCGPLIGWLFVPVSAFGFIATLFCCWVCGCIALKTGTPYQRYCKRLESERYNG